MTIYAFLSQRWFKIAVSTVFIAVGGLIYVAFRPLHLKMFSWFGQLHVDSIVGTIRHSLSQISLPDVVIYNLPGALWLFAYMYVIDAIWNRERAVEYRIFLLSVPFLALLVEGFQSVGVVEGTFDVLDIAGYCCAMFLFLILKRIEK